MRSADAINAIEAEYEGVSSIEFEEHGLDLVIDEEDLT